MPTRASTVIRRAGGAVLLMVALAGVARAVGAPEPSAKAPPAGLAVVELFTSEGCNSCPPADELFTRLAREADAASGRVLLLAWHVDYWDRLGWKDPFALAAATPRQQAYARAMRAAGARGVGVYTPQVIVNGVEGLVGSDEPLARDAIARAAAKAPPTPLTISARRAGDDITLDAHAPAAQPGARVVAVLVEDGLTSAVAAGENAGRTLRHDRVVRAEASAPLTDGRATLSLRPPQGLDLSRAALVAFVQTSTPDGPGPITGAASAALPAQGPSANTDPAPAAAPPALSPQLEAIASKFATRAGPERLAAYEASLRQIEATGVTRTALKVGDRAPDFELPGLDGHPVRLAALLQRGPVVLTWYRGGWCPFCNVQLRAYQQAAAHFAELNASLVAVSPQTVEASARTAEQDELAFPVLADAGNAVAKRYGIVFEVPEGLRFDVTKWNGEASNQMPLPATYIIAPDGTITYAFIHHDYRQRAETSDLLAALAALRTTPKSP